MWQIIGPQQKIFEPVRWGRRSSSLSRWQTDRKAKPRSRSFTIIFSYISIKDVNIVTSMMRKFPPQQIWNLSDEKEGWKYLNSDLLLVACCLCLLLMLCWTVVGSKGSSPTWPASTPALLSSSTTCFSCSGNWICTIFTSSCSNRAEAFLCPSIFFFSSSFSFSSRLL